MFINFIYRKPLTYILSEINTRVKKVKGDFQAGNVGIAV